MGGCYLCIFLYFEVFILKGRTRKEQKWEGEKEEKTLARESFVFTTSSLGCQSKYQKSSGKRRQDWKTGLSLCEICSILNLAVLRFSSLSDEEKTASPVHIPGYCDDKEGCHVERAHKTAKCSTSPG